MGGRGIQGYGNGVGKSGVEGEWCAVVQYPRVQGRACMPSGVNSVHHTKGQCNLDCSFPAWCRRDQNAFNDLARSGWDPVNKVGGQGGGEGRVTAERQSNQPGTVSLRRARGVGALP